MRWSLLVLLCLCACHSTRSRPSVDAGAHLEAALTFDSFDAGPDAGPVIRFVALGDTGKGNAGQRQVGAAVGRFCAAEPCDFVVLLGDNFYPSGVNSVDDAQWQTAFEQPYATVNAPFYAVLGNHDYGGDGAGTELPKGEFQLLYAKEHPKWRLPAHHYRWSLGDADFFAADTNRSMFDLDQAERADFEKWLAGSTARWKLVFGHHPLLSNGPHGNAGSYDRVTFMPVANGAGVKRFLEERVCGRADAYFSGHDHSVQYVKDTCGSEGSEVRTQLVVSGGGSAATGLPGTQPVWYQRAGLGFVSVELREATMRLRFHDADGAVQYERTVSHP